MLNAITIIVLFQLAGEALAMLTGIPVPGSVLGMVFLLLAFFVKDDLIDLVRPTGGVLLSNLSLLFVPAGVGIIRHVARFEAEGVSIAVTLVLSTLFAMAVTAWTIQLVSKALGVHDREED